MTHRVFSVVAPVAAGQVQALRQKLDPSGHGSSGIPGAGPAALDRVHFASFVVFDAPAPGLAGTLVFENCIDGPVDEYLDTLLSVAGKDLWEIFSGCADFKPDGASSSDYLREYVDRHIRRPSLYHIGTPRMSTDQIAAGAALRHALDEELDLIAAKGRSSDTPRSIVELLRDTLHVPPSWHNYWHLDFDLRRSASGASVPSAKGPYAWFAEPDNPWPSRLWNWSRAIVVSLAFLWVLGLSLERLWKMGGVPGVAVGLVVLLALVLGWWRWLTGRGPAPPLVVERLHGLTEREDRGVRNHMASLITLKAGVLRHLTLRVVLFTFSLLYRTFFSDVTKGRLWGLPTIHFAHWTLVPRFDEDGRPRSEWALLFLSNYDGSWETYLDDFLAQLHIGVVFIWANTIGFPWPLDAPTFKHWARTRMSPWQAWFQHPCYGDLTVLNIHNNDNIRTEFLHPTDSDYAARLWLSRFGAIKEGHESFDETGEIEESEIQGLLLSGFSHLDEAEYVFLRIGAANTAPDEARKWLLDVLPLITTGRERSREERAAETSAVNVAITWSGLRSLGAHRSILDGFPQAFVEGIAPDGLKHRSRVLGDIGDSDPTRWDWGGAQHRVDLLLVVFARPGHRKSRVDPLVNAFTQSGAGTVVSRRVGGFLRPQGAPPNATYEHFGFRDGISNPLIEGSWRGRRSDTYTQLVKPGEFILGYPSQDGTPAPGIEIDASLDPQHLLPPTADAIGSPRDFGRNGTYLVCRQLEQDVAGFRAFTARAGGQAHSAAGAEAVGARVVGRWRDGNLVGSHVRKADEASNDFGFATDPYGFGCPIGAHIRRANPRDSLGDDPVAARRSVSRHRILRRGRPYGMPLDEELRTGENLERGLIFIALNSDIERQFEFVQQNWLNNSTFGGLYSEIDPLVGRHTAASYLTVQINAVRQRVSGLSQFVTVKGGEYFFLPSLSSLRYLAMLGAGNFVPNQSRGFGSLPQSIAAPTAREPSVLHKAAAAFETILPWLQMAWALRVPLLLMASLLAMPLALAQVPGIGSTLFLVERRRGIFVVALLASLAAFVSMSTLRIVLLYGHRLGLGHARWRGAARWVQVLAFESLAVPVVVTCMRQTALDREGANPGTFATELWNLAPAAVAGLVAGLGCLWIATGLQALNRDARAELFFPPNPLARYFALLGIRAKRPRWLTRMVSAISRIVVDALPPGIGEGYIDYRRRRVLPGHVFALVLFSIVLVVYATGYFALNPAYSAAAEELPPVAYLLFLLIAGCWLMSGLTFFFDRYHIPALGIFVLWVAAVASLAQTDHYFGVQGPIERALTPHEAMQKAESRNPDAPVIVVASEGMGLASAAWTAEVLTRLTESLGPDFSNSVRMVSTSSGASLGAFHFVNEYGPTGFGSGASVTPARMNEIRRRAQTASSSDGAWGLAYPDLARAFIPWVVPKLNDRGWAMETAWRRTLQGREPTLSSWRLDVAQGWRPAVAFGVTVVETGQRGLLATYAPKAPAPDVTNGRDVLLLTAVRLSAAFPFISPASRHDRETATAYHVVDGGYWDNSGIISAIEWLDAAEPRRTDRVIFIEIRTSAPSELATGSNPSWLFGLTSPIQTMVNVRYQGQPYRNNVAFEQFAAIWEARHHHSIARVVFQLCDSTVPLTWNLGLAVPKKLEAAWHRSDNQQGLDAIRKIVKPGN